MGSRQGDFTFPTLARWSLLFQPAKKRARTFRVGLCAAVGQTAVMAGNGECNLRLPGPVRDFGPGCGVVDFGPAPQPPLERGAVFANVVQ